MKIRCLILLVSMAVSGYSWSVDLQNPESIAFDSAGNRYFISNFGSGDIIQIDFKGNRTIFKTGLSKSLGMILREDILYVVTSLNSVRGFTISDGKTVFDLIVKEAIFLNDITADDAGFLYVTDSNNKSIYKIDINKKSYSLLVHTNLDNPNGIIYDKRNNRLVVCYFREMAVIDEIKLDNPKISTLVSSNLENLDGITQDELGNFYISSWGKGSFKEGFSKHGTIYKYDNSFKNTPEIVLTGLHGPADIYFNAHKNELAIPLFLDNEVVVNSIKKLKTSATSSP